MADGNRGSGGVKTPIEPTLVQRMSAGLDALRGAVNGFFTPTPPMPPVAQEQAKGRQYDYPLTFNIHNRPRGEESGIDFATLRALADNYDLLRIVIETRKDQLCKMRWNITSRDPSVHLAKGDKRVKEIEAFLRKPDKVHTWNEWLRILVEDMLVIDAATVYPRATLGGKVHSLEIMDGSTIKPLINDDGRTPLPPDPAFVQVIKGMSAVHYRLDELIYKPRNLRSWKVYGYSPVEQIVMTVNIAMRRQMWQLGYFTEGNIPEAFGNVPEDWTPAQIREFQTIWDSMIEGDPAAKRKLKFLPGGGEITLTKEPVNKDLFDEWLARIVCFAFSISPQALVSIMNRATAETAAETAQQEGLAPLMTWTEDLLNEIIEERFKYDDLVFVWDEGKELDPKTQSEIHKNYLDAGVIDVDEVRQDIGKDPRNATAKPNAAAPEGDGISDPSAVDATAGVDASQRVSPEGAAAPELDADGKPVAPPVPGAPPAPAGGGSGITIQDTAMNGSQISSLIDIIAQVADKSIPPETALPLIQAAFPAIRIELVNSMLDGLKNFEPPKPDPVVPFGAKPVDGEQPAGEEHVLEADERGGKAPGKKKPKGKEGEEEEEDPAAKKHVHGDGCDHGDLAKSSGPVGEVEESFVEAFHECAETAALQVSVLRPEPEVQKAKRKKFSPKKLVDQIDITPIKRAGGVLGNHIETIASESAVAALKQVKKDAASLVNLANSRAEAWARSHAADLVTDVSNTTKTALRSLVEKAEQEGWSNSRLATEIRADHAFSRSRAKTIARTETKTASSEGAMAGWKASGMKMKKEWSLSMNEKTCDVCEGNAAEGPIPLEDSFSSGDDTAPAHPNCECAVLPVFDDEEEE